MSNRIEIISILRQLIIEEDKEFVAMISGEWGIGKTHFWNEFKDNNLKKKDVVYISLFGLNSLDEIKNEIIISISKYTKYLNKYRDKFKKLKGGTVKSDDMSLSLSGALINSSFSLFSTSDFKNIVICFDDFERLSEKVSLKDVMGLISQFKEQKKCKIIMILNEKELNKLSDIDGKKHTEIFALYKEKIVDYTFNYQPSFDEIFKIVREEIKYFNYEWVYELFKTLELNNIRIMKQAIYQLNHFRFIERDNLHDEVKKEFVEIALKLFVFKSKCNYSFSELTKLREYFINIHINPLLEKEFDIKSDEKKIEINKKYERCIKQNQYIFNSNEFSNTEKIEKVVYSYLDNYNFDKEELTALLLDNNSNIDRYTIQKTINTLLNNMYKNFSKTNENLANKVLNKLKKNKDNLHKIYSYVYFMTILDTVESFIKNNEIEVIKEDFLKKYIQNNYLGIKYSSIDDKNLWEEIQTTYLWANSYIQELETEHQVINDNEILKIFHNYIDRDKYNLLDGEKLNNISSEKYKELILNSTKFVDLLIKFLAKRNYYPSKVSSQAIKNIKIALIELQNTNDDFRWKVDRIINEANILLND